LKLKNEDREEGGESKPPSLELILSVYRNLRENWVKT